KRALGADVDGYVMPMFNSQTAIAYNTAMVKDPPSTYAELEKWVLQNPKKFGYNGIKGGMSGVSFVVGWIYADAPDRDRLIKGTYDPETKKAWDQALARLAAFNKNVVVDARECRNARHAQSRRDRDGAGLGRHVLHLAGRRQDPADRQTEADRAGNAGTA